MNVASCCAELGLHAFKVRGVSFAASWYLLQLIDRMIRFLNGRQHIL